MGGEGRTDSNYSPLPLGGPWGRGWRGAPDEGVAGALSIVKYSVGQDTRAPIWHFWAAAIRRGRALAAALFGRAGAGSEPALCPCDGMSRPAYCLVGCDTLALISAGAP